eukprot:COSAG02_NODE_625_length_19372_cov_14.475355_9_plen_41_part_00
MGGGGRLRVPPLRLAWLAAKDSLSRGGCESGARGVAPWKG